MARIAGTDLPRNKRVEIGLTYIYGIGLSRSQEILNKTNINRNTIISDLTDEEIVSIRATLNNYYQLEGDLKRLEAMNIKRLMEINSYRGKRHRNGLPLRGQRTRTNARTRRGNKKTMAGKKKAPRK
uniref:Ribosomal protein S13 n=1 Tax=Schimmelmannia schousboei TaxID=173468 RepID=A0A1C9C902_9FLOR|nr:ribosomal protein S13 [Schimmelmannia schousboei]AOM64864.1 ribosomal protein S13 [Schimmelmannia schousboei]